jgi:hypothetical protein
MTPINLSALGPVLQVLPMALVFSSQLLLPEKSLAAVESRRPERKTEHLLIHATGLTAIREKFPDPGWSHYGIND